MVSIPIRTVWVGDHTPESLELWTIRKVAPTATEMLLLAAKFHDAVWRLELAAQDENFQAAAWACREIDDIADRIALMNDNLNRAMKGHEQEENKR